MVSYVQVDGRLDGLKLLLVLGTLDLVKIDGIDLQKVIERVTAILTLLLEPSSNCEQAPKHPWIGCIFALNI